MLCLVPTALTRSFPLSSVGTERLPLKAAVMPQFADGVSFMVCIFFQKLYRIILAN